MCRLSGWTATPGCLLKMVCAQPRKSIAPRSHCATEFNTMHCAAQSLDEILRVRITLVDLTRLGPEYFQGREVMRLCFD